VSISEKGEEMKIEDLWIGMRWRHLVEVSTWIIIGLEDEHVTVASTHRSDCWAWVMFTKNFIPLDPPRVSQAQLLSERAEAVEKFMERCRAEWTYRGVSPIYDWATLEAIFRAATQPKPPPETLDDVITWLRELHADPERYVSDGNLIERLERVKARMEAEK